MESLEWIVLCIALIMPLLECRMLCFEVKGIIPPVNTPVDKNGSVKLDVIPQYAQFLQDQGVDGVLVAGTAGEGPTLNVTDKKNLIDAWMEAAPSLQLTVTIQVGGIPLPDAQELAAYAEAAGVDAIMTLPELYYKPKTPKQLVYFVQEVAEAAPETPVLYYHVPKLTGVDVDMAEFLQLATERIPNFRGIKSEDFETALLLQDKLTNDQRIFIADSLYLAPALFMGFNDFIFAEINLFPELVKNTVYYGTRGKYKRARSLYRRLRTLRQIIIEDEEDNENAALKAAMPMITGINVGPIRPPEIRLTFDEVIRLENRLKDADIKIIDSALNDE